MLRTKKHQLIYRSPDGIGGFRQGQCYAVRVGLDQGRRYLLHPVTLQPWMVQPAGTFWQHWEQLSKPRGH